MIATPAIPRKPLLAVSIETCLVFLIPSSLIAVIIVIPNANAANPSIVL